MLTSTGQYWNKYKSDIEDFCTSLIGSEVEGYMQCHYVHSALNKMDTHGWTEQQVKSFIYITAKDRCLRRISWLSTNKEIKLSLWSKIKLLIKQSIAKYYV